MQSTCAPDVYASFVDGVAVVQMLVLAQHKLFKSILT